MTDKMNPAQKAHILELAAKMLEAQQTGHVKNDNNFDTFCALSKEIDNVCAKYHIRGDLQFDDIIKTLLTNVAVMLAAHFENESPTLQCMITLKYAISLTEMHELAMKGRQS